jgi:hypothetical protein
MIVTLDGERLDGAFSNQGTLQALIDQVRRTRPEDSVIVTVAIDGEPLVGKELGERLERPVDQVTQVDLGSADRRQLAADALREVAAQLATVGDDQAAVAGELQAGNTSEAVGRFGKFLEAWQLCQRSILECSGLLGQDLTAVQCDGRSVREHLDGLADKLRELRDAFDARDTVLLADLIQYEVPDVCRGWHGIMKNLADSVADQLAETGAATPAS